MRGTGREADRLPESLAGLTTAEEGVVERTRRVEGVQAGYGLEGFARSNGPALRHSGGPSSVQVRSSTSRLSFATLSGSMPEKSNSASSV